MREQPHSDAYQQGRQAGEQEACDMLAKESQHKGAPLTKREISDAHLRDLDAWWKARPNLMPDDWDSGWSVGFSWGCLLAEREAPNPNRFQQPAKPALQHPIPARFRQATIQTKHPEQFYAGIQQGQAAQVDDDQTCTTPHLFRVLMDLAHASPKEMPTDRLVGCLIGRVDALLQDRKLAPSAYRAMRKAGETHA